MNKILQSLQLAHTDCIMSWRAPSHTILEDTSVRNRAIDNSFSLRKTPDCIKIAIGHCRWKSCLLPMHMLTGNTGDLWCI